MKNEKSRLEEAYDYLRNRGIIHTQNEVADKMKANYRNFNSAFNGDEKYLTPRFLKRFNEAFGYIFDYDWLITGNGSMLKESKETVFNIDANLSLSDYKSGKIPNRQPILDIRVCAGHGIGLDGNENKILEWINVPRFKGAYGITVFGDSMYDKFLPGEAIFVREIEGRNDFEPGACYMVITNEDRYLRLIYEIEDDKENVILVAYNNQINPDGRRKYPDKKMNVEDIKFLYKYIGSLKREQL